MEVNPHEVCILVTHALPGVFRGLQGAVPSCVEVSLAANRHSTVNIATEILIESFSMINLCQHMLSQLYL